MMNETPLPHILAVDDDDRLRELLRRYLSDNGFVVTTASDAADALSKLELIHFDLIVLDIMMPGESGLELTQRLQRKEQFHTPILLLTAMGESEDRVAGLEVGADDYLTKPFEPRELVLRIRAILKRAYSQVSDVIQEEVHFGEYCFHLTQQQLTKAGNIVYLTSQEQALLLQLARQAGKPVSREQLAIAGGFVGNERSVDVQINRLRKKIEEDSGRPLYIQTARGAGYILKVGL